MPGLDETAHLLEDHLAASWLRLAPRAAGTMQNAQRCWQPSWTLTKARERPATREGRKGRHRGRVGDGRHVDRRALPPSARRASSPSSSSGRRGFSALPITRSTPPSARHRLGVGLGPAARHDHQGARGAPGARGGSAAGRKVRAARHRAGIDHVDVGAARSAATARKPRASSRAAISCESTWLSRQPSVGKATVTGRLTPPRAR